MLSLQPCAFSAANMLVCEGTPAVYVSLDSKGADEMLRTTQENIGKPMAVLFIEQNRETVVIDGEEVERTRTDQEVISVATIQGVFSSSFQITGLDVAEARDLAYCCVRVPWRRQSIWWRNAP